MLTVLLATAAWSQPTPYILHPAQLGSPAGPVKARLDEPGRIDGHRAVPLPSLVPPRLVVVGSDGAPCTPATATDPAQTAQTVAGHISWGEFEEATAVLDGARAWMACPRGEVDPHTAHRLWFLAGVLALYDDEPSVAREHFLRARAWSDEPWDEDFHYEWRTVYEAATPSAARAMLHVAWAPDEPDYVQIDGVAVGDGHPTTPGPHIVQLGHGDSQHVLAVDMAVGETWVVDPQLVPPEVHPSVRDGAGLRALTLGQHPEADPLFVTDGERAWELRPDGGWRALPPPRGRRAASRAGVGLGALGVVTTVVGAAIARSHYVAGNQTIPEELDRAGSSVAAWERAREDHASAARGLRNGQLIAAVGGVITATGASLWVGATARRGHPEPLTLHP